MRIAALVALVLALSACSQHSTGRPQPTSGTAATPSAAAAPSSAPQSRSAQLDDRLAWAEAGNAVDNSQYGTVSLDGKTTDLKGDIAFVSPTGKISCVTGTKYDIDGLNCVVKLAKPLPKPADGLGNWSPGYVHYASQKLTVGQFRGDPGLFIDGEGRTLPYDSKLTFGGYTCRLAETGLTCVNPSHRSGVQLSADGIVSYGCLQEVPAGQRDKYVGQEFTC